MTETRERIVCFVGHPGPSDEVVNAVALSCGVRWRPYRSVDDYRVSLGERDCSLLLIDLDGDATQGLALIDEQEQTLPHIAKIAFVDHGDIPTTVEAIKAGAVTCLEKPVDGRRLQLEIEALLDSATPGRHDPISALTPTEEMVLRHILAGKTSREIAKMLHRSPRTVETHRSRIMRKLGASNTVDLVRIASTTRVFDTTDQ